MVEFVIVLLCSIISYLAYEVFNLRQRIKKIHHSFASPISRMMMVIPMVKSKSTEDASQEFDLLERSIDDLLAKMNDLRK